MEIGVPREIKPQENRVGLTPAAVAELTRRGHRVLVQSRAGPAAPSVSATRTTRPPAHCWWPTPTPCTAPAS